VMTLQQRMKLGTISSVRRKNGLMTIKVERQCSRGTCSPVNASRGTKT
jgi:hypothetical protein